MQSRKFLAISSFLRSSILALALCLPGSVSWAQGDLSVDEIVARTNHATYCQGDDGQSQVRMKIVDAQGRASQRELALLRWDEPAPKSAANKDTHCGKQRYYVHFQKPAFLVWKNVGSDDDRWLYLPALDLVKRVSSADKRTSFVGSHFFYEDISGRSTHLDKHKLHETTSDLYVLDHTPKDAKSVEFSRYRMWIHRKTFMVTKVEYYNAQGKKYREYEVKKVESIQGHPTVTLARMTDLRGGGYTEVEFRKVKYDVGVPKDVFSERSLRAAPQKYLR
jgi:outer membrane lipoprotein-sorting protein